MDVKTTWNLAYLTVHHRWRFTAGSYDLKDLFVYDGIEENLEGNYLLQVTFTLPELPQEVHHD